MPVFVIFVPTAEPKTCDATWWLKARREQKATDAEARPDEVDLAFVDDLRAVAGDLRAPRLSVSRGIHGTDAGGVRQFRLGWSRSGS